MKKTSNYADTYFVGIFASEDKLDPVSVKIGTGILLKFSVVPVYCSSKMHWEIDLSALEAERIALSQWMMEIVATRMIMLELGEG